MARRLDPLDQRLEVMRPEDRQPAALGILEVPQLVHARQHGCGDDTLCAEFLEPGRGLHRRVVVDPLDRVGRRVR